LGQFPKILGLAAFILGDEDTACPWIVLRQILQFSSSSNSLDLAVLFFSWQIIP
jgi:hypothetical protein